MTFIHPRTGRVWATEALAVAMDGPLTIGQPGTVTTGKFASDRNETSPLQTGSQYWMNSDYTGPEPAIEIKIQFSDANVANEWINKYASTLKGTGMRVSSRVNLMALQTEGSK